MDAPTKAISALRTELTKLERGLRLARHRIEKIEERLLTEDDLRALDEARTDVTEGRAVPLG